MDELNSVISELMTSNQFYGSTEPIPLRRKYEEPAPFPLDALGEFMGPAARVLYETIQAPDSVCAQSLLAVASFIAQPHRNVVAPWGAKIPLSCFFLTIADSGERKSAIDSIVLHQVRKYEEDELRKYHKDNQEYIIRKKFYAERSRKAINTNQDENKLKQALEKLGPPPKEPLLPILVVQEPTYEALIKLYQVGKPSLALFSDEGGRLIGGHGMNSENRMKTITGLSELWDAKPITRARAGDGFDKLYGRRLSMHLMMQPVISEKLFSDEVALGQGFLARTLVSDPKSRAGTRLFVTVNIQECNEIIRFNERVAYLLSMKHKTKDDEGKEVLPDELHLATEAHQEFSSFAEMVELELKEDGAWYSIRAFASKAPEHVLRISAVLSFFANEKETTISKKIVSNSIEIVIYYLNEMKRIFGCRNIPKEIGEAEKLLQWLQRRGDNRVHLTEIYQKGPTFVRTAGQARAKVDILVKHGWLRVLENSAGKEWEVCHE